MDDKKICFIMCVNDPVYEAEALRYVQRLHVPDGYQIEQLSVYEAESMAAGYQEAMQSTDAKYKVYLHQDTFILNVDFISEMLSVFSQDGTFGMLGVLGGRTLPQDANCYLCWETGRILAYSGQSLIDGDCFQQEGRSCLEVAAVDGLLIATQQDVPWRMDFLDGWDFYDVSQSLEMRKAGYHVVVPYQAQPWCYHDCGVSSMKTYDRYRRLMLEQYPEVFAGQVDDKEAAKQQEQLQELEAIRTQMIGWMEQGAWERLRSFAPYVWKHWPKDTQIREIANLVEIYVMEETAGKPHSEWFLLHSWKEIYGCYQAVRFVLIRIACGILDEDAKMLRSKLDQGKITMEAIVKLATSSIWNRAVVYQYLWGEQK